MLEQIIYSVACLFFYVLFKNFDSNQNKVKYYTRVFIMFVWLTIVTATMCPIILLFRKRELRNSILIIRHIKHLASLFGMKWQLQNEQWLGVEGGAVIISNHQSSLDAVGLFFAWEKVNNIVAIVKKELWWTGVMALAAYRCGAVFIDRKNPKKAYQTLEQTKRVLKTDRAKIWVFPEGTRNTFSKAKLLPFKKGAFALAISAQVPIIPVVFSPHYFVNEKNCIWYNDGKMIMRCLKPVPTEGLTLDDVPELQERLHNMVLETFEQLCNETLNNLPVDTKLATEIPTKILVPT